MASMRMRSSRCFSKRFRRTAWSLRTPSRLRISSTESSSTRLMDEIFAEKNPRRAGDAKKLELVRPPDRPAGEPDQVLRDPVRPVHRAMHQVLAGPAAHALAIAEPLAVLDLGLHEHGFQIGMGTLAPGPRIELVHLGCQGAIGY